MFDTIAELKTVVGGSVNQSMTIQSIAPTIDQAARQHLSPWLGRSFVQELLSNYPGAPGGADPSYTDIYPEVQKALGFLSLYEYSQIGNIEFSEAGLTRAESEHKKTAFKYQEEQYRQKMLDFGYEALDDLIHWLDSTAIAFPKYEPIGQTLSVRYVSDFRRHYSHHISRYTFNVLLPLMEDVQDVFISVVLGPTTYQKYIDYLSGGQSDVSIFSTTATQAVVDKLHHHIQRTVIQLAMREATTRQMLKLDGQNVVYEMADDAAYRKQGRGTLMNQSLKLRSHDLWARTHMEKVRDHLVLYADMFDGYPYTWPEHAASCTCGTCEWSCMVRGSGESTGEPYLPPSRGGVVHF